MSTFRIDVLDLNRMNLDLQSGGGEITSPPPSQSISKPVIKKKMMIKNHLLHLHQLHQLHQLHHLHHLNQPKKPMLKDF